MSLCFGMPLQSGYFKTPYKQAELHSTDLLAGGEDATTSVFARAKTWRKGGFAALNIQLPKRGAALQTVNPNDMQIFTYFVVS